MALSTAPQPFSNVKIMKDSTLQLLDTLNQSSIRWTMAMLNLSITLGELGLVVRDSKATAACLAKAKEAYGSALIKARRSFTARECSDFEFKSFRAEVLIAELGRRVGRQQVAPAADEPLASGF